MAGQTPGRLGRPCAEADLSCFLVSLPPPICSWYKWIFINFGLDWHKITNHSINGFIKYLLNTMEVKTLYLSP